MPIPEHLLVPPPNTKRLFGIISWGHAGSSWIAAALNEHPEIYAAYAAREEYARAHGCDEISVFDYMLIAANTKPEARVAGHVIGFHPHELVILNRAYGKNFYGLYFMAHPILRLAGSIDISRAVGRDWKFNDFLKLWNLPRENRGAQRCLDVCGEEGDYIPCNYIAHINNMPTYVDPLSIVRFEELWRSDAAWHEFVMRLSGGMITDFGTRWRRHENAYLGGHDGVAQRPLGRDPVEVWESFPDYVRYQISELLSDDTRAFHAALSYDMSFIPRAGSLKKGS